jgi:hypothetical protein
MTLKLKHQKFAVVSFQEAHPDFLEQAEICAWTTFMRETFHKYSAGKRYKPVDPAEKTGNLTVPPNHRETATPVENSVSTVPATNVNELIEDYVLWRNCNAIKMFKYYKKFFDKMPVSRAFKIHGVHRYIEDANRQRDEVNIVEGTDVFVIKLQDEEGNAAPILYNPPKMLIKEQKFSDQYLDNLMSQYRKNQKDADELNNQIQKIAIRKAKQQREKILSPSTTELADQICGVENSVLEEKNTQAKRVEEVSIGNTQAKRVEEVSIGNTQAKRVEEVSIGNKKNEELLDSLAKLEQENFLNIVTNLKKE